MRKLAVAMILLAMAVSSFADEVQLKYTRPSRIVTTFFESGLEWRLQNRGAKVARFEGDGKMVPKGVTIIANDAKGILTIEGPAEDVKLVKDMVALFDVEPRQISLQIDSSCAVLNHKASTTSTLTNNQPWQVRDGSLEIDVTVTARVNSDNTITLHLVTQRADTKTAMALRLKQGQTISLRFDQDVSYSQSDPKDEMKVWTPVGKLRDALDEPEAILVISAKVIEKVAEKASKTGP